MILLFHEAEDPEEMEGLVVRASEGVGRLDCRFGLGGFRHYSALSESYREAFEQLRSLEGKTSSISRQRQEARDLRDAFLYSDWDEVQSSYEKYWTEVFMSNDFLVAKARMVEFFACLMGELEKDRKIPRGIDLDPAEEIIELSSVQKWQQWSSCVMDRLRFIIKERKDQFYPKPLSLAMNYILENYAKPLHLAAVAEQCEISQGYLSRLFSEYLNTSFIDYLNNLRINEAVRLLRNEKKPVKEVSHLVGYGDPNYFSRIFKRNLKVSPSDFAKGGSNNEE
jgi:two-component system response regulator YesN